MFERFTEQSRQVVVRAQEQAFGLGHEDIDLTHLEIGLLDATVGGFAEYLVLVEGIDEDELVAELLRRRGTVDHPSRGQLTFTPAATRAFELALRDALAMGQSTVHPEHLLLGVAREWANTGGMGLIEAVHGFDGEAIRRMVIRYRSQPPRSAGAESWSGLEPVRMGSVRDVEPSGEGAAAPADDEIEPIELEAVPTHADRPALQDELGRAQLAEVLAERLRRVRGEDTEAYADRRKQRRAKLRRDRAMARMAGTFMVHVHAPWGAGKSSLLNFLAADLRNRRPPGREGAGRVRRWLSPRRAAVPELSQWIVVEFSAWQHQRLEPPWWWLLTAVQRAIGRELWSIDRRRWAWFWVRDVAWRMWNAREAWITFALLGSALALTWAFDWFGLEGSSLKRLQATAASISAIAALAATMWIYVRGTSRRIAVGSADAAAKFLRRGHDPLGAYGRRFRWLVRSGGRPVAVFVDDLDRCKPEYVVGLLEGIQTLFADEPVVYVVAADRSWLCESFAKVYGTFGDAMGDVGRPLGHLFLEKTFQISMEIPPMTFEDRRRYWAQLMVAQAPASGPSRAHGALGAPVLDLGDALTQEQVETRVQDHLASGVADPEFLRAAVRRLNRPELRAQLHDLLRPFGPLLENNPRAMKRLVNAYGIERDRLLRQGNVPTKDERQRLVLYTILRLRWPRLADHLLHAPEDCARCLPEATAPEDDHVFAALFRDRDVQALFGTPLVDVALDVETLRRYAGQAPEQAASVGA
jgi:hypothetical protein